ncbi:hypothetical protein, partial [Pseudomonas putida]|uniref:hypothetical protein n=1 Tax=Pseudomonas putida TaxID=303 RepID=UPI001A900788
MAFQPFVVSLLAVNAPAAVLHPDAFGDFPVLAPALEGSLGAADQFGHQPLGDLVGVTGCLSFHGMVSTPPVAAGWWSAGCPGCFCVAHAYAKRLTALIEIGMAHEAFAVVRHELGVAGDDGRLICDGAKPVSAAMTR